MTRTRTYYETLGIPREATHAQIKRRFRQLAQKHHPDVAKDKEAAHRLFIEISEAYEVLGDPARRRAYDENMKAQAARAATRAAQTRAREAYPIDGAAKLVKDAQFAFIQRRLNEAASLCKRAISVDPRNARAHVILGDIYRSQGKTGGAIRAYSYALQYNPADRDTEKKLMDLVGKHTVARHSSTARIPPDKTLMVVNAFLCGLVFYMLMLLNAYPGVPIPWLEMHVEQLAMWTWNLVVMIAGASAVAGFTLAINGLLAHPDEEIIFEGGENWLSIPSGLILLFGSNLFFLGAAGFYILSALLQGSLSKSIITIFACVVGVVLFAALMFEPEATRQVMLFGGNVAFLPMLIGWYIGAAFRPLGD